MMIPELVILSLAALLQSLQFVAYSIFANLQVGPAYALSPRDEPRRLTGLAGRLQRALNNHFEGLILFTIAVLVVVVGERTNAFTAACAWTYLAARILYVPAYALGWAPGRTVIWSLGWLATLAILLSALF